MALFNKKEKASEEYYPNNKLYIILLLIAVVLTCISLPFKGVAPLFTIWTSITCGGVASIIVAWLIDGANCRRAEKKTAENRETLLDRLCSSFDNGLQILIYFCGRFINENRPRNWFEWVKCAYIQITEHPDFCIVYNRAMVQFFEDLVEQGLTIQSQEASLLEAGIISKDDIEALSTLISVCELACEDYHSKMNEIEVAEQFDSYCELIRKIVNYSPAMRKINEKPIEPRLYQIEQKYLKDNKKSDNPAQIEI